MGILGDQFKEQQAALSNFKQQSSSNGIQGVTVPVAIKRNGAKVRMGIILDASVLQSPDALEAALSEIEQIFDLDVYQPSSSSGGQSGFKSGNGYSGGYQKRY